jgi:FAD/FMN-containing dehydrogenase
MTDLIRRTLNRLAGQLRGRLSMPGDGRYAAATAIWAKPVGRMPRAVAHCRTAEDVQMAVRAARDCGLPLSVRGGGHDWAGRALCAGIVVDLREMNGAVVASDHRTVEISGGARAADVVAVTDRLGLAPVTGSVGAVGMTGLTLGGGYGPLIGRFGLALDNLIAAEVVLADGRIVAADDDNEPELFWALRGGGGNFGVVTRMQHRLHRVASVRTGMLFYPFSEAFDVLEGCADIAESAPEELSFQIGLLIDPGGAPVVLILPTWCGDPEEGERRVKPFLKLGTLLAGAIEPTSYKMALTAFDAHLVDGRRELMETCWIPRLETMSIDVMIAAMEDAVSRGCAIITHEFKGAASRVLAEATAFGLRRDHVLVEILATFDDRPDKLYEHRHQRWTRRARQAFDPLALPGGYPNLLAEGDAERAADSYGGNAERLIRAKRRYDPDNLFRSAIPLPASEHVARVAPDA